MAGAGSSDPIARKTDTPPAKSNISELFLGALVGAVAAYFVPKALDRIMPSQLDPYHGQPVEMDIED